MDRDWHGKKVIRAVPAGAKIPADTIEWLKSFAREQSLPLLFFERLFDKKGKYAGQKKLGYGPPSFIRAVETEVEPEDVTMFGPD